MRFFVGKPRLFKLFLLAALVLLSGLLIVGCARAPSRGWSGPTVSEGILYVGTLDGEVIGLDTTSNGTQVWTRDLPGTQASGSFLVCSGQMSKAMSIYSTPVVHDGVIYVGSYDGNLYAIEIERGMISEFETDGAIVGSPIVENNSIFIGSSDGKLYALEAGNIRNERWVFKTGDKIWSTPVVDGGVVYIGSSDHNLYAIDADSGKELWHFEAQGAILSTPVVFNGTVYIGSSDRKFYAIDAATEAERLAAAVREKGASIPSREATGVFKGAGNWFWTQALAYNNVIYVGNLDHKLYVLDADNIENKLDEWKTDGMIRTPPVLVKGRIVIGSADGNLYTFDPEGAMAKFDLEAPILAPLYADPENGVVYAHAQDGDHTLYAIDVETGSYLWEQKTS